MGETFKPYVCSYRFNGESYGITIPARDFAEAVRRLQAIGANGTVDGEMVEEVPAIPGAGLYVRAKIFLMNLIGGRHG